MGSSARSTRAVVIVGGGVSGVAVALQLLRRARDLDIVLVERGGDIGRGVAYAAVDPVFRLNVAAAKMSLDPAQPNDFVTWARAEAAPEAFLPRRLYGDYVADRFTEASRASASTIRVVRGEATGLDSHEVVLADGTRRPADVVVLATGIGARTRLAGVPDDARIIDGWDETALARLPASGDVLILGAGLTAIDVVAFLESRRFSGRATALSRRGLLPRPHLSPLLPAPPLSAAVTTDLPNDLRALIAWGRRVVREAVARGDSWQQGVDSIRPHSAALWRRLPPDDKAQFVRSVRPYWDVLRHRAPTETLAVVEAWRESGRLSVVAGRLVSCHASSGGFDVEVRRAVEGLLRARYDAIVRCTGPSIDYMAPLFRDLVDSGRAARDPTGLGIATDDHGHVVSTSGEADPRLFAIGAPRRASAWETTSVAEIAAHALAIARAIV